MTEDSDENSTRNERRSIEEIKNDDPDWLTETDVFILRTLATELVLTPSIIAENIDHARPSVSRRLNTLQAAGHVKKIDRGKYIITDEGKEFLDGRIVFKEE